jgi:hypothetical protein
VVPLLLLLPGVWLQQEQREPEQLSLLLLQDGCLCCYQRLVYKLACALLPAAACHQPLLLLLLLAFCQRQCPLDSAAAAAAAEPLVAYCLPVLHGRSPGPRYLQLLLQLLLLLLLHPAVLHCRCCCAAFPLSDQPELVAACWRQACTACCSAAASTVLLLRCL